MVSKLLEELGIPFRETRFTKAPSVTYAVYHDSLTRRGADDKNMVTDHDYSIELYEYAPDPETEAKLEQILDDHAISYEKQERYWLQTEQIYQLIYEFEYTNKEDIKWKNK